jgi:hypothetical protein
VEQTSTPFFVKLNVEPFAANSHTSPSAGVPMDADVNCVSAPAVILTMRAPTSHPNPMC